MGEKKASAMGAAAVVLVLSAMPLELASSADATTGLTVSIETQPIQTALLELCKQGHLQLVVLTASLPTKTTAPLHGKVSLGTALDFLLRDTGLTYKIV